LIMCRFMLLLVVDDFGDAILQMQLPS